MSIIYYNGQYRTDESFISYKDSGYTTGIGIFDSMLVQNGQAIYCEDHYKRIAFDTKTVIDLPLDLSFERFEDIIRTLIQDNDLKEGYVRIRTTVTGGIVARPLEQAKELNILIQATSIPEPQNNKPVKCAIITDFPRIAGCILENCKRLDYSRSYAARRAAEELGAEDAIMVNTEGNVACGTTSNVFIQEGENYITPPLSEGVLAGVTRKNLLKEENYSESAITIDRLKKADEIYLTNSFTGMRKVELVNL
ncbi:MAG: aminotransferase class IV [Pseudomonadota bacterium]